MSPATLHAWSLLDYSISDDKGGFHAIDQTAENDVRAICAGADLARMDVAFQLDFKRHPGMYRAMLKSQTGGATRKSRKNRAARKARTDRDFRAVNPRRRYFWRDIVGKLRQSNLHLFEERAHLDAASRGVLHRFLAFARRACPARRFILHFQGHSFGPMGLFYDSRTGVPNPHVLRLNDLTWALKSNDGPVDVVLFRDCFMDNLEAAYELHGAARYMIGSQAQSPIRGVWPWLNLLSVLTASVDSSDVARSLVLQLENFYNSKSGRGGLADVPCALIDIDAAQQVATPLKRLVVALSAARNDPARCRACATALERARLGQNLSFSQPGDPALLDVLTMCRNLQELDDDRVSPWAKALEDVVQGQVIASFHVSSGPLRGLALYYKPVTHRDLDESFVQASDERDKLSDARYYRNLALSRATGWDQIALNPLALSDHQPAASKGGRRMARLSGTKVGGEGGRRKGAVKKAKKKTKKAGKKR
jgi:cysteine peptidase C11 family protein